jgi:mRNA interferase RelE/StbE
VKQVVLLEPAVEALQKHRNIANRILDKLELYAKNPGALRNQVTELRGMRGKRLRVGDFRVLFEETETEIIVLDLGPRGSIYE